MCPAQVVFSDESKSQPNVERNQAAETLAYKGRYFIYSLPQDIGL